MESEALSVSRKDFRENPAKRIAAREFLSDTDNLVRPAITYDAQEPYRLIDEQLLTLL
jgi:hypothetical protein